MKGVPHNEREEHNHVLKRIATCTSSGNNISQAPLGQNRNLFKVHKQNIHTCAFLPRRSFFFFFLI